MIKTIAIDLDGVLNTYCGNYNENEIAPPKEGVHEFLAKLAENYKIEIFTVRNTKLTAKWLIDNDLDRYVSNITNVKNPFASAFIDDRAIRFNPKSDIAYFYKGVACHSVGKDEEAYQNYTKAIELNKKMIDAYFNRGQLIFNTNPKLALDDFVSAVALDPKFIDAYYSIAAIQKNLGQYEDAIKNLDKIIELEPHAVNAKALKKLILTKYLKD